MTRPIRGSFHHRIYVDLVCDLKLGRHLSNVIDQIAEARNLPHGYVRHVFNRYVRPQLQAGTAVSALV